MTDRILNVVTPALLVAALYFGFVFAPTEASMGTVQRIFYFHVPAGITSYIAFIIVGIGSVMFLYSRNPRWDRLAYCSAEIGVLFATANILMGMLWAKPVWLVWWTWDARLTLQLLLALIFVSYLMLGAYVADPMKRASLQAVVGLLGAADVPLNYMAIRWWRGQHPEPVIAGGPDSGLDPAMYVALAVSAVAILVLYIYLLRRRLAIEASHQDLTYLEQWVASE
jgi:heme exporter protein C